MLICSLSILLTFYVLFLGQFFLALLKSVFGLEMYFHFGELLKILNATVSPPLCFVELDV